MLINLMLFTCRKLFSFFSDIGHLRFFLLQYTPRMSTQTLLYDLVEIMIKQLEIKYSVKTKLFTYIFLMILKELNFFVCFQTY